MIRPSAYRIGGSFRPGRPQPRLEMADVLLNSQPEVAATFRQQMGAIVEINTQVLITASINLMDTSAYDRCRWALKTRQR